MVAKKTILLVEDDENTMQLLELYVQWAGYRPLRATDGRAGLAMARSENPALIVVDIMLPEVHGLAVCHDIKADPATRHIKVMVISVKNFPADRKQVSAAGADAFMAKPLDEQEFVREVKRLLGDGA